MIGSEVVSEANEVTPCFGRWLELLRDIGRETAYGADIMHIKWETTDFDGAGSERNKTEDGTQE